MPKTALVTGAARGIGRAAAEALRKAGCKVIGLDREACDVVYDLTDIAGIAKVVQSLGDVPGNRHRHGAAGESKRHGSDHCLAVVK